MSLSSHQRDQVETTLKQLQSALLEKLEAVDGSAQVVRSSWERPAGGGGTMGVIRGKVVEKAGVNVSAVYGDRYPGSEATADNIKCSEQFFATGLSTITHMMNPHAPIGHMNVRVIAVGEKLWFGGGADLTPFLAYEEDTQDFHSCLKRHCAQFDESYYPKFSAWCDEYFFIPHRQRVRGVGGIFFDRLSGDFSRNLAFISGLVEVYSEVFPRILQRRKELPYSEEEKDQQLYWRGRYAEFNLIYDEGTKFGLKSGGNVDAIFVSLPPVVKW
jgi:coproporphyrinogen III oxidase